MMNAQPDPSDSLVFECDFEEPPEKVWRALTEPRLLEAWLQGEERATPRGPRPGDYEILTAEPHRRLRYLWRDRESGAGRSTEREVHSIVTVELAPVDAGGTHLRLTHGEFRIVSAAASVAMAADHPRPIARPRPIACVTPIARARRRTITMLSFTGPSSWRRAA